MSGRISSRHWPSGARRPVFGREKANFVRYVLVIYDGRGRTVIVTAMVCIWLPNKRFNTLVLLSWSTTISFVHGSHLCNDDNGYCGIMIRKRVECIPAA